MNVHKVTRQIKKVSDIYAKKYGIRRDANWYLLKLQEEMADVFCHVLLLARHHKINLEKEVEEKWLVWNKD
ncbi:hypothetical protein COT54_00465 [Candidatus Collierbacteria bacterium CG09_land_8_20_14_0_10_46_12]|uniref:Pyrophosphatase n=1 Tax=Candidatus Collierbacteria bacterium CG09_land_8_20_14_0_10_46_12 TaxID=1974533 RepID=A0A2H0X220_9BACT|nr:MAG: hypothetical protein COT54_00465 [Candidatus Collierbacteria bacterium CG09_land_8_20_14_0_10_46_12]